MPRWMTGSPGGRAGGLTPRAVGGTFREGDRRERRCVMPLAQVVELRTDAEDL